MTKTAFLFDLDGTLTDPGLGIKNSIRYALEKYGMPSLDEGTLDLFIGPPLLDSFTRYCGADGEQAKELLRLYREYFSTKGIFENTLFPEVPSVLERMKAQGCTLCLATSKPEEFAMRILEHFELVHLFDFVGGSTMDETRTEKDEVIAYVLEQTGISPDTAVMVGDRRYDVEGGKKHGLYTVGVLFGYGSREELTQAGADRLIGTPEELLDM